MAIFLRQSASCPFDCLLLFVPKDK